MKNTFQSHTDHISLLSEEKTRVAQPTVAAATVQNLCTTATACVCDSNNNNKIGKCSKSELSAVSPSHLHIHDAMKSNRL